MGGGDVGRGGGCWGINCCFGTSKPGTDIQSPSLHRETKDIAISFRTAPHWRLMPPSVTGDERRVTKRGNTNP